MRIVSFFSRKPGEAFVNGKCMSMDDLFVLLQEPGLDLAGKESIKSFLKLNGFNPNPNLSCENVVVNGDNVTFLNGGLTFSKKISQIPPGRVIYHPNGWSKNILSDQEIALIKRSKRRCELLK